MDHETNVDFTSLLDLNICLSSDVCGVDAQTRRRTSIKNFCGHILATHRDYIKKEEY